MTADLDAILKHVEAALAAAKAAREAAQVELGYRQQQETNARLDVENVKRTIALARALAHQEATDA